MSQLIGRESDPLAPKQSSQIPFLVVATLSVGFLLRALWIVTADLPDDAASELRQGPQSIAATRPATESTTLSAAEYAMLMSVCPTGAADLPSELKPIESPNAQTPDPLRLANRPGNWPNSGRISVASKPDASNPHTNHSPANLGDWLVAPEEWYGPDGMPQPAGQEASTVETTEPVVEEPQANEVVVESEPEQIVTAKPEIPAPVQEETPVEKQPLTKPLRVTPQPTQPRNDSIETPEPITARELAPHPFSQTEALPPPAKVQSPVPQTVVTPHDAQPPVLPQPSVMQPSVMQPSVVAQPSMPPAPAVQQRPSARQIPGTDPQVQSQDLNQLQKLNPHGNHAALAAEAREASDGKTAYEAHRDLYLKNCYPSARDCAECHKQIYEEWSTSSHAYAYVSPMFHKFEQTISFLSQGTVGHFCTRCHSPVAASMGLPRSTPLGEMSGAQVEGVTCIVCHRVNERYGKTNGERRVVPGSLEDPIYGGIGGEGVREAIANRDKYKIKTSAADKKPGQLIHNEGRFFDQLTRAEACTSCHQVAVHPGIKLEVVWEQYRNSPACKKGVSCQDCHMGRIPGVPSGYNYGPIAEVGGKVVNNHRKQANHSFFGPGYSIAHPGIFPQHKDADKWTLDEWLEFDWRAGWGTDEFEEQVEEAEDQGIDTSRWFPTVWADLDDRCDARDIITDNQKKLERKHHLRELVMENGSQVDGPFFRTTPRAGQELEFDYLVANLNEGHNLPTASLGAQPQLWANVVLIGPRGQRLWETGYLDTKGDLCDIHSEDVRHGRARFDSQLFNLQTMFLYTGAVGTDREWTLPVNISLDQVPHLRPGAVPVSVLNHPPFIRMESRSLAPLGKKRVKYKVPANLMCEPGRYRLSFRLRSRLEPMYFMRFCDATNEMMRSMTEQTLDIHSYSVEFDVR